MSKLRVGLRGIGVCAGAVLVTFGSCGVNPARVLADYTPPSALAPYPVLHLQGSLVHVDLDQHHATLVTDNGSRYILDIRQTDIALPGHSGGGSISALKPGMRVRIDGEKQMDGTVQAIILRVIGLSSTNAPRPSQIPLAAPPTPEPLPAPAVSTDQPPFSTSDSAPDPGETGTIHLRGTIQSIHLGQNDFVAQINNQTRTVVMDNDTAITSNDPQETYQDGNRVPFQTGDRVTVVGELRDDGTVLAQSVDADPSSPALEDVVGRVSQASSFWSRDIKVQMADGREITVEVPDGISILKDGSPLSIHALTTQDQVRVDGIPDGSAMQASQIVVLDTHRYSF